MLHIILVTVRPEIFHSFAERLSSDPEVRLDQVTSGAEALSIVRTDLLTWLSLTPKLRTPIPSIW